MNLKQITNKPSQECMDIVGVIIKFCDEKPYDLVCEAASTVIQFLLDTSEGEARQAMVGRLKKRLEDYL